MKKLTITFLIVLVNTIYGFCQPKPMESNSIQPQNPSIINFDSVSKRLKPYVINKTNNVRYVKIKKNILIPSNQVEIKLFVDKNKEYFNTIELIGNSGYQVLSSGCIAFKDIVFPFKGQVKFHVTGQFIITEFIDVEFQINEACGWTVEIFE
ncbi:MAG: hypothetical protein EHM93_01495 [Bacteroidales bacterium]|nr:MAG: hypothetical protein EHM93_01495 [Bacteroidales bacterium]